MKNVGAAFFIVGELARVAPEKRHIPPPASFLKGTIQLGRLSVCLTI